MNTSKTPSKLTRAQLSQALDSVPVSHLLGKGASRELTGKQKRFALEVAKGSSGAEAYRKAYKTKGKTLTQANEASRLKARPDVAAEVEAYRVALESETYRTPAALRALVVQTLASVLVDPDAKQAVKVQAAKAIGAMTDVSLFTHRTEQRIIRSSDDARAELMEQIRSITNAQAVDVTAIDSDADSLLAELSADAGNSPDDETHPPPGHHFDEQESRGTLHTIPHEQSQNSPNQDPTPSHSEDPPSSFEK